jgi:hypothetical protein
MIMEVLHTQTRTEPPKQNNPDSAGLSLIEADELSGICSTLAEGGPGTFHAQP